MTPSIQVTFDCADPDRLARFWADALGYEVQSVAAEDQPPMRAIVDPSGARPRILFIEVPEAKAVKNRVHLDVDVGGGRGAPLAERRARVDTTAARLLGTGATRVRAVEMPKTDEYWVVMQDPEGNEFCLY